MTVLQACQDCIDLAQKAGPGEDQQGDVLKACIEKIDIHSDAGNQLSLMLQALKGKPPKLFYRPGLLGNWPNGIDLETGKTHSIYPVFSKTGDVLKTGKDILNAIQAELLTAQATKPHADTTPIEPLGKKIELSPDKYPQAYDAGIPKNRMVILDIPAKEPTE